MARSRVDGRVRCDAALQRQEPGLLSEAQFEAAGYEIPETWEELLALTETIAD
jgi:hypothetical protein